MLGNGYVVLGKKSDIYLNSNLTNKAQNGFSGNTKWFVDVLEEYSESYKVKITHNSNGGSASGVFNPTTFYLRKNAVIITYWNRPIEENKPSVNIGLETGDIMILSDKNGNELGTWTFKKK